MSILSFFKSNRLKKPPTCTAVIAAAGLSQRCEGEDKLFYEINSKPVIAYTLDAFQKCRLVDDIIIVAHEDKIDNFAAICRENNFNKVSKIIKGGSTRVESVLNGIFAVSSKARLIAIHDGARPCTDIKIIEDTIHKAALFNAAAPAVLITSTVKRAENDIIYKTVNREDLYDIQTPQIFRAELIKAALTNVVNKSLEITDDCTAVEIIGAKVFITDGSRKNIKITDNEDLKIAEAFLKERTQVLCG